jgi:hypothetical protein
MRKPLSNLERDFVLALLLGRALPPGVDAGQPPLPPGASHEGFPRGRSWDLETFLETLCRHLLPTVDNIIENCLVKGRDRIRKLGSFLEPFYGHLPPDVVNSSNLDF